MSPAAIASSKPSISSSRTRFARISASSSGIRRTPSKFSGGDIPNPGTSWSKTPTSRWTRITACWPDPKWRICS
eukprot:15963721-Heterocapsa_arctica.AAC.1